MTATSLGLAMRNLTQVEKLGSKTRVSILAVLKPSPDQLSRVTPTLPLLTYPEITYPLAAPQRKPSGQQPPDGGASQMSLSAQPQSTLIMPTKLSNSEAFNSPSSHLDIEGVDGAPETQPIAAAQLLPVDSSVNEKPREVLSARDLKASKTFAVLRMPQGDNPWDLGSWLLNLQTLMGTNIFDWLLPVKRSPCTKHEHQESHYAIGPSVDMLKATVSFINAEDIRGSRGGMPKQNSYRDHQGLSQRQGEARRRKRRKHSSARRAGTQEPSLPYDISEVTNHAVQMDDLSNNERYT
jgi:palmitoyltransferase